MWRESLRQFVIGPVTLNIDHIIIFDFEGDGVLQIAFEGQVDVALIEHEHAIDRIGFGKADDDATRPMG